VKEEYAILGVWTRGIGLVRRFVKKNLNGICRMDRILGETTNTPSLKLWRTRHTKTTKLAGRVVYHTELVAFVVFVVSPKQCAQHIGTGV
jgi:hypothetical protein